MLLMLMLLLRLLPLKLLKRELLLKNGLLLLLLLKRLLLKRLLLKRLLLKSLLLRGSGGGPGDESESLLNDGVVERGVPVLRSVGRKVLAIVHEVLARLRSAGERGQMKKMKGKLVPYVNEQTKKSMPVLPPIPRHQSKPWRVHFLVWRERYDYFITCILRNLQAAMVHPSVIYDWNQVRYRLERYLYETSSNRNKSYYLLAGPRG